MRFAQSDFGANPIPLLRVSFPSAWGSEPCEGAALALCPPPRPPHPSPFPPHIQWGRKVAAGSAFSLRSHGGAEMPLRLPLLHRPARTGTEERVVLNPGTRIGPGRRERSSRRGRESPRSRERCPGPRGAALPPLAKGSAPWGLAIRVRIGSETALCFLSLLQRLCLAARAGCGVLGHSSQTQMAQERAPR